MPDFVVSTAFKTTKDTVTKTLEREAKAADKFGRTASRAFKKASKGASLFKSMTSSMLVSKAISTGTAAMSRGIRSVIDEFIDFDESVTRAAAAFGDINRESKEFEELKQSVKDVGATTEFTAAQAAEGLKTYAKAGFDASTAMGSLQQTAELATSANVSFAEAADLSITAMEVFKLKGDGAVKTSENLKMVNDTLAQVVNSANLDFEEFGETMRYTAPAAKLVGASFKDMAILTGLVAKSGMTGSMAGTALNRTYLALAAGTPKAKKALGDLGIETEKNNGDMKDALTLLVEFKEATKNMGKAQRLAAVDTVFGERALKAVGPILDMTSDELKNYKDNMDNAKDANAKMAAQIRGSLGNKIKVLQSAAVDLGFKFVEAFEEDGKEGVEALTEAIRNFDMKPIIEGAREVLKGLKWLFKLIKENWTTVKFLASAFIALKVTMAGISFINAIQGALSFASAAGVATKAGAGMAALKAPVGAAAAGGAGMAATAAGVGAAGVAGVGVGMLMENYWLNPMREEGLKFSTAMNNFNYKMDESLRSGFEGQSIEQLEQQLAASIKMGREAQEMVGVHSLEDAVLEITSIFTDAESPMEEQERQFKQLIEQTNLLSIALAEARAAAAAQAAAANRASIEINANINNAPPGSTVDVDSKGSKAPKVNVNQAGAA